MSDFRVLVCRTVLNASDLSDGFQMLRQVHLPNAVRFVAVSGKVDAGTNIKTFNFESGYPSDPGYLQTLAAWAEAPIKSDVRFRDGFDLYCLRHILKREGAFDNAILLRGTDSADEWRNTGFVEGLFQECASPGRGIIFNLRDARAPVFLDLAWELYATGAVYAMAPYSFVGALNGAAKALGLQEKLSASDRGIPVDSHRSAF